MKRLVLMLFALASAGYCGRAQTSVLNLEQELKNELIGKQFVLRDFAGMNEVTYVSDGDTITRKAPFFREFAVILPEKVRISSRDIQIEGKRVFVVIDNDTKKFIPAVASTAKIIVKLGKPIDPLAGVSKLRDLLFFHDLSEALSAVPKSVANQVPAVFDASSRGYLKTNPLRPEVPDEGVALVKDLTTPPKLIRSVNPEFPGSRPAGNFAVRIGFEIDEKGHPGDLWVTRSAGLGFDEAAADAARQYVFSPSIRAGQPVRVRLNVEVDFDLH